MAAAHLHSWLNPQLHDVGELHIALTIAMVQAFCAALVAALNP